MANEQTIANLIVRLSAQTTELAAGLKKAEAEVQSFSSNVTSRVASIATGFAAAFVAVAGYSLVRSISEAKDYAVQIAETAEKVGVSSESLSRMAEAADDVGVSIGSLATGIKFLSRNMLEASQGAGEQRNVFKALKVEYESAPGVLRSVEDTMLDLADVFSRMEDGPAKTAMALKLLGRSGTEMVPYLNQGRAALEDVMRASDAAGTTISGTLGARSRELKKNLGDVSDALRGISLTVLSELMPAIQSAAKFLLGVAESMNRLRGHAGLVSEALRYTAAIVIPLLIVKLGSMISVVGIANVAMRAFGATLAFFSGPIGWLTLGITSLSVAWTALGKGARDAARAHEEFATSVRTMKLDDLKESLRDAELQMTLLIQKYQAMIEELERGGEFTLSFGKPKEADETKKKIDELKERIKLLQGAIGDVNQEKIAPPVISSEEVLKKLQDKIGQLRAEMVAFRDPVAGASAALEEFIRQTVGSAPMTDQLRKAVGELRGAFNALRQAQVERASVAAIEKGQMAISVAGWEAYGEDLKRQYDTGLIGIKEYYAQRRNIIVAQTRAEILALQQELAKQETPPERKAAIPAEITTKEIRRDTSIAADVNAEADAWKNLWATIGEGDLAEFIAKNDLQMSDLENRFADGLVATRAFFDERRKIIAENAQAEVTGIETTLPGLDPVAAEAAANKIRAIRNREISETAKTNREETLQLQTNLREQMSIQMTFAELKAAGQRYELDQMVAQGYVELAALDQKHAGQLEAIRTFSEEKILLNGEYLEKAEALERVKDAQDEARRAKKEQLEKDVLLKKLEYTKQGAQMVGEIFGNLYELSGKKIKAFYYLQKASAMAEAIINVATGVTAALKLGPILGPVMAGIITALGATQIAMIASSTIKGMFRGGPVTSGSGTKDDVPAMLTRGEYVQPAPTVRYYGTEVMEAIRRRIIPRDVLKGFGFFPVAAPQFAFATGGVVSGGGTSNQVTVPVTVYGGDKSLASRLRVNIEEVVVKTLREHTR